MKFQIVAEAFDSIEQESSRTAITKILANLLAKASPQEAQIIVTLALGQLHPPHIGTQFNFASKNIIPVIAHLLDISDEKAATLLKKAGDAGLVVADGAWEPGKDLTVQQVYDYLCDLEKIEGTGSQEKRIRMLVSLLHDLSPVGAKYVVRIVIGKLRLGFSDMTIVDALSWMAVGDKSVRAVVEDAYNVCADIGLIARTLKEEGLPALEQMQIQVGTPIRPAAAERMPTAKAIITKLGTCVAQPKLDGFRLQVHVDKTTSRPKVHFFSRNLQDMSAMFPELTKAVAQLPVETCVAEGEAIAYDPNTGSFLPFQETVKRRRKHDIADVAQEFPLKVFLFDLLYLDGTEQFSRTHAQRRKELAAVLRKTENDLVQLIDERTVSTGQELEAYFSENIAAGLEGLVVKRPDSQYQPGKRNFNWIKLKRQESGQLEDTIDCVILGYYAGSGKRAQFGIGAFLVGVYNEREDRFETVAKVGTGLSDDAWRDLKVRCDEWQVHKQPHNVVCAKELKPDVWVTPEIVCAVRADEITQSPVHAAGQTDKSQGMALRFPRFMSYREDKSAQDATTVTELKALYKDQFTR